MDKSRIGVFVDSFGLGLHGGIDMAARIGVGALQLTTVSPELSPWGTDKRARKALMGYIAERGLSVASICGDLGGHGLARADENAEKIAKYMAQVELAADLRCDVITTHIGVIPEDPADPRYNVLLDAMGGLANCAQAAGVKWAIETGPEKPAVLRRFIDQLPASVGVNLDPANLVMVIGCDPIEATRVLADRIYHCHAKDGKMLKYAGPEAIYGFFAEGGIGDMRMEEYMTETPLGMGAVDVNGWVRALLDTGYKGYFTIERETGADPVADIRLAVEFLTGV